MCGRYVIARAAGDLLAGVPLEETWADENVAPTKSVPILVDHAQEDGGYRRAVHTARWGLLPRWAKEASFSSRTFNARSETVTEKPSFRHAVVTQRCAVPANGYYEWLHQDQGGSRPAKIPYYIHPRDPEENIYFAGLYEWWKIPSGPEAGQWLLSTTILTMDSPGEEEAALAGEGGQTLGELGRLHDRLPIPLEHTGGPEDALSTWLRPHPENDRAGAARDVEAARAQAYRVAARWRLDQRGPTTGRS